MRLYSSSFRALLASRWLPLKYSGWSNDSDICQERQRAHWRLEDRDTGQGNPTATRCSALPAFCRYCLQAFIQLYRRSNSVSDSSVVVARPETFNQACDNILAVYDVQKPSLISTTIRTVMRDINMHRICTLRFWVSTFPAHTERIEIDSRQRKRCAATRVSIQASVGLRGEEWVLPLTYVLHRTFIMVIITE